MQKTITVVLEYADYSVPVTSTGDIQKMFDCDAFHDGVTVTNFVEGDALSKKPEHFSDRELDERGLPPFAYALDASTGGLVYLERGMMGFFPRSHISPEHVDHLNAGVGVTKAQANAMHHGSVFGWHSPAADPNHRFNKED